MKYLLPLSPIFLATAAAAHEGAHLHPHEMNSWMVMLALLPLGMAAGYVLGRVHK